MANNGMQIPRIFIKSFLPTRLKEITLSFRTPANIVPTLGRGEKSYFSLFLLSFSLSLVSPSLLLTSYFLLIPSPLFLLSFFLSLFLPFVSFLPRQRSCPLCLSHPQSLHPAAKAQRHEALFFVPLCLSGKYFLNSCPSLPSLSFSW